MISIDYGVEFTYMTLNDLDLPELLSKYKGVFYLFERDENFNKKKAIGLGYLFEKKRDAELVYKRFESWEKNEEESFQIDFVETEEGYMLWTTRGGNSLLKLEIPLSLKGWIKEISTFITHKKSFDKRSEDYLFLKKDIENNNKEVDFFWGYIENNEIKLLDVPPFKKKKINYYKEHELSKDEDYLKLNSKKIIKKTEEIKKSKEEIIKSRIKNLKYFFPITYIKLKNENFLEDKINQLSLEYETSEIYQAICNMIVNKRMNSYGIDTDKVTNKEILDYLLNSLEEFDSLFPEETFFSLNLIRMQINKDRYNENSMKKKSKKTKNKKKKRGR